MWKQAVLAVAGLVFAVGDAAAQTPDAGLPSFPPDIGGPSLSTLFEEPAPPGERLAFGKKKRGGDVSPFGQQPLEDDGFSGPIYSTRLPARNFVPSGAALAAPVILPQGVTPHGDVIYDVYAPGMHDMFAPVTTRHPEKYVRNPRRPWVWGSAETLFGKGSGVDTPTLITTGPAAQGLFVAGMVGQPGTVVLFGGRSALDEWRIGMRAELGVWFDRGHAWGVSGRYYSLFSTSDQFTGIGDGTNVLNLPQLVPVAGTTIQFPAYVGFPGVTTGTVAATFQTTFMGGDLNLRKVLHSDQWFRMEMFGGYRQMHLGDELADTFRVQSAALPFPIGPALIGDDSVRTRNNFYGGQLGGLMSFSHRRWVLEGTGIVALGVNASDLDYSRTRLATVGAVTPIPLVQANETGQTNYFGTVAEGGVRVGFRITTHAKLTCGYTGLYWWNVRRAQEQYNLSPTLANHTTRFTAHMFTCGAELRY